MRSIQNLRTGFAAVLIGLTGLGTATAPAWAMGRSEDPRNAAPQPVGTEADPAIRNSEQNLKQLLFQPDRTAVGADTASTSTVAPAETKIRPDR